MHLWHSRRGSTRIRSELTAAIYDKALRRKDASGVVAAKEDDTAGKDSGKDKDGKEKKVNADTGKVVNLMAGDATRIAGTFSSAYMIYSTPFQLVIASVFLYQLLGWTAFAGAGVLVIAIPLNSYLSNKSFKISKDMMKARDKRIGVMNELIGAIQFIKFFAWLQQWKERATQARKKERQTMVRCEWTCFGLGTALTPSHDQQPLVLPLVGLGAGICDPRVVLQVGISLIHSLTSQLHRHCQARAHCLYCLYLYLAVQHVAAAAQRCACFRASPSQPTTRDRA